MGLISLVLGSPALLTDLQVDDYLARVIMKKTPFAQEHYGGSLCMFDFASGDPERTRALMDLG